MSAMDAAVTLGEVSGWSLSNLQMQKMLYLAQMFHLGEHGSPIFGEDFEAWKLGPVLPNLYRKAKIFGSQPVKPVFNAKGLPEGSAKDMIRRVYSELPDHSPWKLVSITHWEGGAWAKHYQGDGLGEVIPKADIISEFRARTAT